jgi:CRISPR-associated protein Csm3
MQWKKVVELSFQIKAEEGLQIRGSGGGLEIGGVDPNLAVIRNPATGEPYIPGSSLKGKLRSVLERAEGKLTDGDPCRCGKEECLICIIFGAHMNPNAKSSPTRIVVRDAFLSPDSQQQFHERQQAGKPVFEEKTENTIDRKSGAAKNPRTNERVLPGTKFDAKILLHVYDADDERKMVDFVRRGLGLIQSAGSLGAGGTRGYGRVRFLNLTETSRNVAEIQL